MQDDEFSTTFLQLPRDAVVVSGKATWGRFGKIPPSRVFLEAVAVDKTALRADCSRSPWSRTLNFSRWEGRHGSSSWSACGACLGVSWSAARSPRTANSPRDGATASGVSSVEWAASCRWLRPHCTRLKLRSTPRLGTESPGKNQRDGPIDFAPYKIFSNSIFFLFADDSKFLRIVRRTVVCYKGKSRFDFYYIMDGRKILEMKNLGGNNR